MLLKIPFTPYTLIPLSLGLAAGYHCDISVLKPGVASRQNVVGNKTSADVMGTRKLWKGLA